MHLREQFELIAQRRGGACAFPHRAGQKPGVLLHRIMNGGPALERPTGVGELRGRIRALCDGCVGEMQRVAAQVRATGDLRRGESGQTEVTDNG